MGYDSADGDVAIFWDYENCHPPSQLSGYDIVQKLRHVGHRFGSIKLFKAYFELTDPVAFSKSLTLRSELQCSGVSITDCPHNGRKDVADKMIMVDMLAYAIDNPAPSTIILISGDRDFAYAVSILRLRRYRVVVVSLSGIHSSLKAQASVFVNWATDVLGLEIHNEEIMNYRPVEEPRSVTLSPTKSRARKPAPPPPLEEEEVDLMAQLTAARTRKPKPVPTAALPLPVTPQIAMNNLPDSLPSVAEDEGDDFIFPSRSPSRTESAPAVLGSDKNSPPSTIVDTTDYVEGAKIQASSTIVHDQKPTPASASISPLPPTKPVSTATSSIGPILVAITESPSDEAKAVVSPVPIVTNSSHTPVVHSASSTVVPSPEAKAEIAVDTSSQRETTLDRFRLLIERLELHRVKGTARPLRSTVAVELATRDNDVYRRIGVQRFSQYTALAEKEGVIELGGREGGAWISLRPAWHGIKMS